jgi:uncharacterized protein (DUF305 family)
MRLSIAAATLLLPAVVPSTAGCNGSSRRRSPPSTTAGVSPMTSDRRAPFTPGNDVEFIDFFVPHHRAAIAMADEVIARGQDARVLAMAQEMREAQTAEIASMQAARRELTGSPDSPAPPPDAHLEADLRLLRSLSGRALDQQFLDDMIPHHAAGLAPAHRALPNLRRADLQQLAQDIVEAQAREVGEMKDLLEGEAGPPPAPGAEAADTSVEGDVRVAYTAQDDVAFIDFFVPHHRAAIEMADVVIDRGADPRVRGMAEEMKAAQAEEIARMTAARRELTGSPDVPAPPPDLHMETDLAAMRRLRGLDLDRRFLEEMIPHHGGALPVAHRSEPRLARTDMQALARSIYGAQAREIGEMRRHLDALTAR